MEICNNMLQERSLPAEKKQVKFYVLHARIISCFAASHTSPTDHIFVPPPLHRICVRCCELCTLHLSMHGSYDKIIITIVPSYSGENITCLAYLLVLCTHRQQQKLMMFSRIALYYGNHRLFVCKAALEYEHPFTR